MDDLIRRMMLDAARQEYGSLMEEKPEHDFLPEFERKMQKLICRAKRRRNRGEKQRCEGFGPLAPLQILMT